MEAYVKSSIEDGIAEIEFFHPQSNSLPGAILSQLAEEIVQQGARPETQVIVLRSGGDRAFCAGASFDELVAISNAEEGKNFFSGFARVINACRSCGKLIIGRVQGKAVGGGVGVASACDYVFATKYASVKLSELAIGIGPFVVGPAVERKMGLSAFSQLSIDATNWQTAHWAQQHGLYQEVYESADEMDSAIQRLASTLSQSNPEALSMLKAAFWQGTEHWGDLLEQRAVTSGRLVLSDFTKNAIANFKTK